MNKPVNKRENLGLVLGVLPLATAIAGGTAAVYSTIFNGLVRGLAFG